MGETETDRQRQKGERHLDRLTEKRQTDGQTDRQTDRQRQIDDAKEE